MVPGGVMDPNAGLVTGEVNSIQLVSYQSQGCRVSALTSGTACLHADPLPVVQYQFTAPPAGDAGAMTEVSANVSLVGVQFRVMQ